MIQTDTSTCHFLMGGTSCVFPLFSNKAFERYLFGSKENRIRPAPSDTCEKYTSASRYLSWSLEHQIFRCCLYGHFGDVPFHIISSAQEGIIICPSKEDLRRYIAEINLAMLACPGEENTMDILCVSFAHHLSMSVCLWDASGFRYHYASITTS